MYVPEAGVRARGPLDRGILHDEGGDGYVMPDLGPERCTEAKGIGCFNFIKFVKIAKYPLGFHCFLAFGNPNAADWEEEAQGEDLLSDEEGDKEPEDNLDYKVRVFLSLSFKRVGMNELYYCNHFSIALNHYAVVEHLVNSLFFKPSSGAGWVAPAGR